MRKCPVDDFTLTPETYEGVTIDVCPHCQGVWLDSGELETLQKTQDVDYRDVPTSGMDGFVAAAKMAAAKSEGERSCVACDAQMAQKEYGFSSQVMIDNCPKGCGIWLDKAELSQLEKFYEDEQSFADYAEAEILKELQGGGIRGFFSGLLGAFK